MKLSLLYNTCHATIHRYFSTYPIKTPYEKLAGILLCPLDPLRDYNFNYKVKYIHYNPMAYTIYYINLAGYYEVRWSYNLWELVQMRNFSQSAHQTCTKLSS